MMMSLFSMFDPSASFNLHMNWIYMVISLLLMPSLYWCSKSRVNNFILLILNTLYKEFSSLFSYNILFKGSVLISCSLFLFIMFNNITSNFPYTFCCSAHIVFSLSLSVPIWLSIILFYWFNLTKTMLSHLVPMGTPGILMPLMVLIELTSNIIRPFALSVRLTANLIAGHLLMALLGNTLDINSYFWMIILLVQTGFMIFELMVAIIQSYVFSVLMTLYSSEIS
uniref:ATP synthase subunit a n=1 Tax=Blastopsylla occidentalis TaxID=121832 RepID=A0A2U9QJF3_BLAOC|nr:ATP synthase F0 subunit 6 [Blastopsylla occidentalis]AWU48861.1 ATP synthase F0 subunit 6 [Blastopsylla occidentalis]